jgi:hypothetical protein
MRDGRRMRPLRQLYNLLVAFPFANVFVLLLDKGNTRLRCQPPSDQQTAGSGIAPSSSKDSLA